MSEARHLADTLEGLFTRPDNGWFTPFTVATSGLTAVQATSVPAPRFNSIWALTNHLRFWQEVASLRLRSLPVDRQTLGDEHGWPPPGDPADEQGWQAARDRVIAVNRELAALVASLSDVEIGEPIAAGRPNRYQVIQGVIAHNSYHTCEIISVRHMLGLWLERT